MENTAAEAEAKGDVPFAAFEIAVKVLSAAIDNRPTSYYLYSERSTAHASLHNYSEALADATKSVELKPTWSKGYSCLGAAHLGLHQYDDAVAAYMKGLEVDPNNKGLKSGLAEAEAAAARARKNPSKQLSSFGDAFSLPEMEMELGLAGQKEKESYPDSDPDLDLDLDPDPDPDRDPDSMESMRSNTRVVTFKVPRVSGMEILDDGYRWKKLGTKGVLDSKYLRNYYKCANLGCSVKKRTQISDENPNFLEVTYRGIHYHPHSQSYSITAPDSRITQDPGMTPNQIYSMSMLNLNKDIHYNVYGNPTSGIENLCLTNPTQKSRKQLCHAQHATSILAVDHANFREMVQAVCHPSSLDHYDLLTQKKTSHAPLDPAESPSKIYMAKEGRITELTKIDAALNPEKFNCIADEEFKNLPEKLNQLILYCSLFYRTMNLKKTH